MVDTRGFDSEIGIPAPRPSEAIDYVRGAIYAACVYNRITPLRREGDNSHQVAYLVPEFVIREWQEHVATRSSGQYHCGSGVPHRTESVDDTPSPQVP